MSHVTDRKDLDTTIGPDGQQKTYLVLPDEERAKGFVRPVRHTYLHTIAGPKYPLRDLHVDEQGVNDGKGELFVKFEEYPEDMRPSRGRYWTQRELDGGCGTLTTMSQQLAETWARRIDFYGSTFCCGCMKHYPVGAKGEFIWEGTEERVGT